MLIDTKLMKQKPISDLVQLGIVQSRVDYSAGVF